LCFHLVNHILTTPETASLWPLLMGRAREFCLKFICQLPNRTRGFWVSHSLDIAGKMPLGQLFRSQIACPHSSSSELQLSLIYETKLVQLSLRFVSLCFVSFWVTWIYEFQKSHWALVYERCEMASNAGPVQCHL